MRKERSGAPTNPLVAAKEFFTAATLPALSRALVNAASTHSRSLRSKTLHQRWHASPRALGFECCMKPTVANAASSFHANDSNSSKFKRRSPMSMSATAVSPPSTSYNTSAFWERLWRSAGIQAVGLS